MPNLACWNSKRSRFRGWNPVRTSNALITLVVSKLVRITKASGGDFSPRGLNI